MVIFRSEAELLGVLDQSDALISECLSGGISVYELQERLGLLHSLHALDGHESDGEELALMERHGARLQRIDRVLDQLAGLCADSDAATPSYVEGGRYGSAEAFRRLRDAASFGDISE